MGKTNIDKQDADRQWWCESENAVIGVTEKVLGRPSRPWPDPRTFRMSDS